MNDLTKKPTNHKDGTNRLHHPFPFLFMFIHLACTILLINLQIFSPISGNVFAQSSRHILQEAQVLKALVLGEEERGQSQYQVMCFVTKFQKGDFITSDAMAKLRQVKKIHRFSPFF